MSEPLRRQHPRLACSIPASLHSASTGRKLGDLRLIDLSLGGASAETALALEKRQTYEVRVSFKERIVRLAARVAWEQTPRPDRKARAYGLAFVLTTTQEEPLREIVEALRRLGSRPLTEEPPRPDYWSV